MAVVTSVMVRVRNADSEQPAGAGVNVGGEASAVAARTATILSSKKRCRSRASIETECNLTVDSLAITLFAGVFWAVDVTSKVCKTFS